ncbi:MAG: hypothetical protein CSA65_06785 [Proteobacteria bacterium]|nr:MAG: hypothetical protein CSA65_06785 [Pseudomonadota bacterium]
MAGLSDAQREQVIREAVAILKDRRAPKLLAILEKRLADGDYSAPEEASLDAITVSIVRAVQEQLER